MNTNLTESLPERKQRKQVPPEETSVAQQLSPAVTLLPGSLLSRVRDEREVLVFGGTSPWT